jgi:predicted transcriptional regulator
MIYRNGRFRWPTYRRSEMSDQLTPDELNLLSRIMKTATDTKTMNDIAEVVRRTAHEHADLTTIQIAALAAAAGMISGTARALQRERDAKASEPLTSMDV